LLTRSLIAYPLDRSRRSLAPGLLACSWPLLHNRSVEGPENRHPQQQ